MEWSGLFVTGTDTGVGKTFVASAIVRSLRAAGLSVGAYKPAVSGAEESAGSKIWRDVERLSDASGDAFPLERIAPQRFEAAAAPPVGARAEGRSVDATLLREGVDWWRGRVRTLIVEGAGGLLSPLTETESNAELARDLGFPVLVVRGAGLATINHPLLTLEAPERGGLRVAGIVLNHANPEVATDDSSGTNGAEIAARTTVPILGVFPFCGREDLLREPAFNRIHWQDLISYLPPLRAGDR